MNRQKFLSFIGLSFIGSTLISTKSGNDLIQKTDKHGECSFIAIFPGWYTGRITHLHVKVWLNDSNVLTTNCFFPREIENEVYKSPLYPKGNNPQTVSNDIELRVDKDS